MASHLRDLKVLYMIAAAANDTVKMDRTLEAIRQSRYAPDTKAKTIRHLQKWYTDRQKKQAAQGSPMVSAPTAPLYVPLVVPPTAPQIMSIIDETAEAKKPSWLKMARWVADNDSAGDDDALDVEAVSQLVTVALIADTTGVSPLTVAEKIVQLRKKENENG